jgi:hypothetical protein
VTTPPDSFFEKLRERDRDTARKFYKKYIDLKGMPVVASAEVADAALQRTYDIVTHLLAGRPDILEAMTKHGTRLIIIGKGQVYTDMPEYRNRPNREYLNERVRGTGGFDVTSFGEENSPRFAEGDAPGNLRSDSRRGRPRGTKFKSAYLRSVESLLLPRHHSDPQSDRSAENTDETATDSSLRPSACRLPSQAES